MFLVLLYVLVTKRQLQAEIDVLAPQARKYQEICGGVKAALRVDRTLLRSERERDLVVARLAGNQGDDSFVMLERCLPAPFPMEAWERCRANNNYECMETLLGSAEASIK